MNRVDPDPIVGSGAFHRDGLREQAHASLRSAIAGHTCRSPEAGHRGHDARERAPLTEISASITEIAA